MVETTFSRTLARAEFHTCPRKTSMLVLHVPVRRKPTLVSTCAWSVVKLE